MKKVIIGPTFYAAGQALQAENDVLVIGRNSSIGDEWSYSYRKIDSTPFIPDSDVTVEILTELAGLSLSSPEENAIAVSVMLYKLLEKIPEKFKLWTEIESIKKIEDGYELTIYTVSGREVIQCDEIIDNTPDVKSCPEWGQNNIRVKRLNMLVCNCADGSIPVAGFGGLTIRSGRTKQEAVVEYQVDPKTTMIEARKQLLKLWEKRPETAKNWKIATFGAEFDYDLCFDEHYIQPGWEFMNPLAFASPAAAFDAGITGGTR